MKVTPPCCVYEVMVPAALSQPVRMSSLWRSMPVRTVPFISTMPWPSWKIVASFIAAAAVPFSQSCTALTQLVAFAEPVRSAKPSFSACSRASPAVSRRAPSSRVMVLKVIFAVVELTALSGKMLPASVSLRASIA